jgi:hypothetical protein
MTENLGGLAATPKKLCVAALAVTQGRIISAWLGDSFTTGEYGRSRIGL